MNERFEQLARQAANGMLSYDAEGDWSLNQHEVAKFPQLIVRECVSTLNDMHLWQSVNNQNYPNSWHDPKFAKVYLEEKRLLLEVLTKGDPDLHAEASRYVMA